MFLDANSEKLETYVDENGSSLEELVDSEGGYSGLIKLDAKTLRKLLDRYSNDEAEREEQETTQNSITLAEWFKKIGWDIDKKLRDKLLNVVVNDAKVAELVKTIMQDEKWLSKFLNGVYIPKDLTLEDKDKPRVIDAIKKWASKNYIDPANAVTTFTLKMLFAKKRLAKAVNWKDYLKKCCINSGVLSGGDKNYVLTRLEQVFTDENAVKKLLKLKIDDTAKDLSKEVATKLLNYFGAGN